MSNILFSAGYFFPRNLFACFFPKSVCRTFFLKSPIIPSKVKWSAPKIHQTFGQLTDSDLSIISKDFWNNRGQNSLGKRGGIRFYLPLPGKSVRTYGDVITKFSRMDSLPNFLTHGAPLLDNKTSTPEVFCSCSFILIAHFETILVMVSYYGYEIWRYKRQVVQPFLSENASFFNF